MPPSVPVTETSTTASPTAAAYDPQLLAAAGERLAARLAEALAAMHTGQGRVLPEATPEEQIQRASDCLEQHRGSGAPLVDRFDELLQTALSQGIALHHPGYVGYQVPPPVPLAGLFDAAGAVTNQGMAIYEMGPWAMAVEQALVRKFAGLIGWSTDTCNGLVTHGGACGRCLVSSSLRISSTRCLPRPSDSAPSSARPTTFTRSTSPRPTSSPSAICPLSVLTAGGGYR